MNELQRLKNLEVPKGPVDVVIDTDAFNEVDDQFAISYLLRSTEKLNTKAIYAAPFTNENSTGPADGMEKSYQEIFHILDLADCKVDTFRGSDSYLKNEYTPVDSPAARDLVERVKNYSTENPLYVLTIGAITNIASAILMSDEVIENTVVVWLGGNARHYEDTAEFNLSQDVAAARVVMDSGVPFIQLPCMGVVSAFSISETELEKWFIGKNKLATYLAQNTINSQNTYVPGKPWTRVLWDVTTVGWLLNDDNRFMKSYVGPTYLPAYDNHYSMYPGSHFSRYVYFIERDNLMEDLIRKIAGTV